MKNSIFHRTNLSLIHWPDRLWKSVAWTVIVCFTVNCITPAVVAAKTLKRDAELYAAPQKTEFDLASDALIALEETLDRMDRRLQGNFEFGWQQTLAQKSHAKPPAAAKRIDLAGREDDLAKDLAQLEAQQGAINAYFAQTQSDLKSHKIDASIQARAKAQSDQYAQMHAQLKTLLQAIHPAKTEVDYKSAVAAANAFLHAHSSKPKRAKFDPDHLAFGPPKERPRQAITDAAALRAALNLPDPGTPSSASAQNKVPTKSSTATTDSSSKTATTSTKPATRFANVVAASSTASVPANLSATEDVQITPAIIAKAQALNNNALAIYQFVRNNLEYMPTYGSIQGSDYALQTLRGNDMDQASLLIALLRAANIPAHYVYGTIQVPIEQVENWVGGVTDPMAALDLMGQGGIPTLGLTQGGVVKYAQIEHVWVEAQIGFAPGRGAITSQGTTWVPMDPSFKQYAYTQGMNLQTAVPFDAQGFANTIQSTSTINATEGWVQNVDQNYINTQLTNYQTQVTNYVNGQNPNATVGDVIGTKTIAQENLPMLAGSLPYKVTAIAGRMDALPTTLRWAFHYQVDGEELLNKSLPSLAGHLMALSFSPASAQDEATLESYIPPNITDPSQLPTSLPAGVVQLKSEFSIDGKTIATGPTYGLGADMTITKGLYQPNRGWQDRDKTFTAGSYQAVGLDGAGLSKAQVVALQVKLENTRTELQNNSINGLTKHDLTGSLLQTSIENYFVQTQVMSQITARTSGVVTHRLPSYGSVATNSQVSLFFGIPVKVIPDGVLTDMDRIASTSMQKANDQKALIAFNQVDGSAASRTESGVLEQQYSTPSQPLIGVSAVNALAVAEGEGERIYTITADNASAAMAQLSLPSPVVQDIADSINAGKVVTTGQSTINYGGQATAGYIILDPTTGSAAYKIANGADGGKLLLAIGLLLLILAVVVESVALGLALLIAGIFVIGCALSWINGSTAWFNSSGAIVDGIIGLLLDAAGFLALPITIITVIIGILLAFSGLDDDCKDAFH